MKGMMMQRPLRIADILEFGAEQYPRGEIVSVRTEGDVHRYTYPDCAARTRQLANGLTAQGVKLGDRIATLAWNGYRHLELYYAISGLGAICHTINPRLSPEQLIYIINHAEDRMLFLDTTFVPLIAAVKDHLPKDMVYVLMCDKDRMPADLPFEALNYEDILDGQPDTIDWPEFDENTASGLCYTSGTTGNPKGALYSHRSTVLHAMMIIVMQSSSFVEGRKVLPVVPLFHVNAWGLPYSAPLSGLSIVFPGPALDGASLYKLMDDEGVYSAWGVPTIWMGLMAEIKKQGRMPDGFKDVVVGGSACPRSLIKAFEERGASVSHAWGMTEMSPVGSHGVLPAHLADAPLEERLDVKQKQGRRCFGVEFKIVDEDGTEQPHDGEAIGELFVRGNTIVSGYFNNEEASAKALDSEGWFGTGDVASIEPGGTLVIQDRAKDLVKSGGEWISSIDLENLAMAHPGIGNAAVIAVPHKKWDERPVLVAVAGEGDKPTLEELHRHMEGQFAKWQMPDDILWVDDLPLTATGKVSKLTLRQTFKDYVHPDER